MDIKKAVDKLLGEAEGKSVDRDTVIDFLIQNPDGNGETTDKWAEEQDYDPLKIAYTIYALAVKAAKFLRGGKSGGKIEGLDSKELAVGMKVESEHVEDDEFQQKISADHITEFPHYYTDKEAGLAVMEKKLSAGKEEKSSEKDGE